MLLIRMRLRADQSLATPNNPLWVNGTNSLGLYDVLRLWLVICQAKGFPNPGHFSREGLATKLSSVDIALLSI